MLSVFRRWFRCCDWLIVTPIVGVLIAVSFVVRYFMSILVLQSS